MPTTTEMFPDTFRIINDILKPTSVMQDLELRQIRLTTMYGRLPEKINVARYHYG